jgi:gamma-glutamyltranspeptidase/glutathione hydrolase
VGSPGGRTIINTVLHVILNVVDFEMNVQQAIDAPRFHHQWLPDRILHEKYAFSAETAAALRARGHALSDAWPDDSPTAVHAVLVDPQDGTLQGAADPRGPDAAALGR